MSISTQASEIQELWSVRRRWHEVFPQTALILGGPSQVVDETCGRVISTHRRLRKAVIAAIAAALLELAQKEKERISLSRGAIKKALQYTWRRSVDRALKKIEKL